MSDDAARQALARLARATGEGPSDPDTGSRDGGPEPGYRETIRRATEATDDVETAARFVEDVGLDALAAAVERADRSVSGCADEGRRALDQFRAFRRAAAGDQFHPGRGTSLGGGDIGPSE